MGEQRIDAPSITENWRYSLPGGILAAIFVALSYVNSRPDMSLNAVFLVAIVVGFLSKRRYGSSKRTGALTGLVGATPAVWVLARMVLTTTSGLSGPAWFTVAGTVMAAFAFLSVGVLALALSTLVGELGARIGGAIANSRPPSRTPVEPDNSSYIER
jgi:hypothetical protein